MDAETKKSSDVECIKIIKNKAKIKNGHCLWTYSTSSMNLLAH